MTTPPTRRTLYIIVCAAGPAPRVGTLVSQAQDRGWDVQVITTPNGREFIDVPALEAQTGHAVRSDYRKPGDGTRSAPQADAIIVAPATYNTINKWALGISDTYALGILAEAIGLGIPVAVLPFVNAALAAHPAYHRNVAELRAAGVTILHGKGYGPEPHAPGTGSALLDTFPWHLALDAVETERR